MPAVGHLRLVLALCVPRRPEAARSGPGVARPNSTMARMRAQFWPRPFARVIHSHSAIGTRHQTIHTVMPSALSWLTWAAVRQCPSTAWWALMAAMTAINMIRLTVLTAVPDHARRPWHAAAAATGRS